jgi:DNA-binding transcriptional MerR regulator
VSDEREYRIDELAREAGATVRNVRAYQDRGLLPPPRRSGRVGWYSTAHLARLRLIQSMLDRGYSLGNIAELVGAWEQGHDLGQLLGLEEALAAPWSDEASVVVPLATLQAQYALDDSDVDVLVGLGLLECSGDDVRVVSPRLMDAGAELVAVGVPLPAVLAHARRLRSEIEQVASGFVDLVTEHVFDPLGDHLPASEIPRLADTVRRLRSVAQQAVDAELALAMERTVEATVGDRLERILDADSAERAS